MPPKSKLCLCCLDKNVTLVSIATCHHAWFLNSFFENKLLSTSYVCNICHSFLKKAELFKKQVEQSILLLNIKTKKTVTKFHKLSKGNINKCSLTNLTKSDTKFASVSKNGQPDQNVTSKNSTNNYFTYQTQDISEVQIEPYRLRSNPKKSRATLNNKTQIDTKPDIVYTDSYEDTPNSYNIDTISLNNEILIDENSVERTNSYQDLKFDYYVESLSDSPKDELQDNEVTEVLNAENVEEILTKNKEANKELKDEDIQKIVIGKEYPKLTKKEKEGKKMKQSSFQEKFQGKYNIVDLSLEQIMKEREIERRQDRFVNAKFRCDSCIIGFDHESTLLEHNTKKHTKTENGYQCNICQCTSSSKKAFQSHNRRHATKYECAECGHRTGNPYSVLTHYKKQHGPLDTMYTCHCGFSSESHSRFRYHRYAHHKDMPTCAICRGVFADKNSLKIHMIGTHKKSDRLYPCPDCDASFAWRSALGNHACTPDARRRLAASCRDCKRTFSTMGGLRKHLRNSAAHLAEGTTFTCDVCGATFRTKLGLRQHITCVHFKNYVHECPKCSKVFGLASLLNRHIKNVHEKSRPPRNKICEHCGKAFFSLQILSAHVRTHTGERPLACGACPATFAHKGALYTHNKLKHAT